MITDGSPDVFNVSLKPDASFAALIGKADLLVQRWLWDGRPVFRTDDGKTPVYGFPFAAGVVPAATEPMDSVLFGSRDTSDRYETSRPVDFLSNGGVSVPLETRNHGSLPGALYYRFALRAHSRYEALYANANAAEVALETYPTAGTLSAERWVHKLVPCRLRAALPRPALRAILPLTLDEDGSSAASLLLVFDDQWYRDELAGLAEMLDGELLQVALPDSPLESRPQFGPDPILRLDDDPYGGDTVRLPLAKGAMGYTFDTSPTGALFTRSSFVQPPPKVMCADGKPRDLSWHFLQLRYRRRLDPAGVHSSVPAQSMTSEWTEPVWAQLLPSSGQFRIRSGGEIATVAVGDLTYFAAEGKVRRGSNLDDVVLPAKSTPGPDDPHQAFTLLALVTRRVTDAFGNPDRESFLTLARLDNLMKEAQPPAGTGEVRVRLLELQHRRDYNLPGDENLSGSIFDQLFPASGEEVVARIVRVSPPLKSAYST